MNPMSVPDGLTTAEVQSRFKQYGTNEVAPSDGPGVVKLFLATLLNPLTMILLVAGGIAAGVGD